jgi:hypothetical protein
LLDFAQKFTDFRQVYSRIECVLRDAKRPAYAVSFDASSGQEQALRQSQLERKKTRSIMKESAPEGSRSFL